MNPRSEATRKDLESNYPIKKSTNLSKMHIYLADTPTVSAGQENQIIKNTVIKGWETMNDQC